MKNIITLGCALALTTLAVQAAYAGSFIKIRGGGSNNTYTLDYIPVTGTAQTPFATTSYSGTNYGLTFLLGDAAYLDLASSSGTGTYNRPTYIGDLQRTESSAILGINGGSLSGIIGNFYIGYKSGETKLNPPTTAPIGSSNLDFTASGMVLGAGLGIPFAEGRGGLLGINMGVGLMGAKYTLQNIGSAASTSTADNALGYNYGILYTLPITRNIGITLDYKNTSYIYTFNSGLSTQSEMDEKFSSALASLYLQF